MMVFNFLTSHIQPKDMKELIISPNSSFEWLIKKIEMEQNDVFKIILTGGNSHYFKGIHNKVVLIDEFFTSKALNYILNEYVK